MESQVTLDVSSVKLLSKFWDPQLKSASPTKKYKHRALEDIKESIMELQYYKDNLWRVNDEKGQSNSS
jgi:oligoribonuclease